MKKRDLYVCEDWWMFVDKYVIIYNDIKLKIVKVIYLYLYFINLII